MTDNKKNILILPRWYPNRLDVQLGTFIRQQARLISNDFNIYVIYVQAYPLLKSSYELETGKDDGITEITVYFKPGKGTFRRVINIRRYKKAQRMAFEKLDVQPDFCHVHVPYRSAFLALELHRKGIPFFVTEHWSGHLTGEFRKKNRIDKKLFKKVLSKAKDISTVSKFLQKKFKENTGFDSRVIPNYIQKSNSTPEVKNKEVIKILSVSDMNDRIKNISGLLRAWKKALDQLQKDHPKKKFQLTIIGGGPDEQKIRDLAEELKFNEGTLQLTGRKGHEEVIKAMQDCDFYICNSNFETFGMTVAEALMAGKPVISTNCGGPEEFLKEYNSITVQKGNDKQLSDTIVEMCECYDSLDVKKIAEEIEQRFGKENVLKMWKEFYAV